MERHKLSNRHKLLCKVRAGTSNTSSYTEGVKYYIRNVKRNLRFLTNIKNIIIIIYYTIILQQKLEELESAFSRNINLKQVRYSR